MSWLVIGSCARELAILKKLKKDNSNIKLYCVGSNHNPEILSIVENFTIISNLNNLLKF